MSCATEVEITNSNPAAVERAAARAPAVTRATTQFGNPAISGLAITIMSALTVNSLRSALPSYRILPSLFLSSKVISEVVSHLVNQSGIAVYSALLTELIKLTRANAATAGAVV